MLSLAHPRHTSLEVVVRVNQVWSADPAERFYAGPLQGAERFYEGLKDPTKIRETGLPKGERWNTPSIGLSELRTFYECKEGRLREFSPRDSTERNHSLERSGARKVFASTNGNTIVPGTRRNTKITRLISSFVEGF
jgi:hypothetical protein